MEEENWYDKERREEAEKETYEREILFTTTWIIRVKRLTPYGDGYYDPVRRQYLTMEPFRRSRILNVSRVVLTYSPGIKITI